MNFFPLKPTELPYKSKKTQTINLNITFFNKSEKEVIKSFNDIEYAKIPQQNPKRIMLRITHHVS